MTNNATSERPPAQTWQEVDLHVRYAQQGLARVEGKLDDLLRLVPKMATTDYIDEVLKGLTAKYATQEELRSLRSEIDGVRKQVEQSSVTSRVKQWAEMAQRFSAIAAFVAVIVAAGVHMVRLYDRVPAEPVKAAPK